MFVKAGEHQALRSVLAHGETHAILGILSSVESRYRARKETPVKARALCASSIHSVDFLYPQPARAVARLLYLRQTHCCWVNQTGHAQSRLGTLDHNVVRFALRTQLYVGRPGLLLHVRVQWSELEQRGMTITSRLRLHGPVMSEGQTL